MKKVIAVAAMLAAIAGSARAAGTACEDLARLSLPRTQVTAANVVAAGAFTPPAGAIGGGGGGNQYANLPAFCRVQATLRPTSDSDIKIEVWLPVSGWNNRLQAVGNGAFMSSIFYGNLAQAVRDGYVGTATNTGKEGNNGDTLLGHPEKVKDWGYRAVHEMTVAAKAIITAHYGNPAKYSYWNSCSTGGRQGLVAAEYYPNDFDGIADGDAANPMTVNQASTLFSTLSVNKDAASFISQAKWNAYRAAVKERCDAADGVKDGLLNNPLACKFDPAELECRSGDNDTCLTAAQVASMKTVLAGMKNPRTGEQLHPGWAVGSTPNSNSMVGREPEQVAVDTFRVLFNKADWDYRKMDFDKEMALAQQMGRGLMDASEPAKASALFARGGKLLMYHGWNDGNISALLGIDNYNRIVAANGGRDKTFNSVRLFMVPGMGHCQGGEGPNAFDKMEVITKWVEEGKAPGQIVASHSTNNQVDRTRPLCPYPQVAKYQGSGSTDEAANFSCAAP